MRSGSGFDHCSRCRSRAPAVPLTTVGPCVAAILLWLEVRALDEPGARYGVGVPGTPGAFPAK